MLTRPASAARDIAVAPPPDLAWLGETTARLSGNPQGPLVVLLGGISGDRFVGAGADGGAGWWPGLVGAGRTIDPVRHRILGLDFAADASGRRAPSTHDQARILAAALGAANVGRADLIIGASYGGMVALAFAEALPERVGRLVILSAGAAPHPAATAVRELQRRVVALGLANDQGDEALSIARGMAMLTYRTREEFEDRFGGGIPCEDPLGCSEPGAYLRARGDAYPAVMSPQRFLSLSASIDRHRVDPARIATPALLIGATSDQLVPPGQMQALHDGLAGPSDLHLLDCLYGHDMFLKEGPRVGALVDAIL